MEWPISGPEPEPVPIILNNERPSFRSKLNSKTRFAEDVGDQTRIVDSKDTPYQTRTKSSGSRRGHSTYSPHRHRSYDLDDEYISGRSRRARLSSNDRDDYYAHSPPRRRRRSSHGHDYHYDDYPDDSLQSHYSKSRNATDRYSEDTDFDPAMSGHERSLPSLTFHFNFAQVSTEEGQQVPTTPRSIKQSVRPDAKEYRYKLYHENIHNIVRSRYNGGIQGREDSTVELITDNVQNISSRKQPELLKWIQLERQYPNFDSFIDHVSHLDCLDEEAKQDAMSIMHYVRDQHGKPLQMPQGKREKLLEPNVTIQSILGNDDTSERSFSKKEHPALLLCMPYFCLAPYSTYSPSQGSDFYPMRTLLQSWHMSTPKKRDLQQAICGLEYPTKGQIFHIPQIWCLILGNDLLVTCTHSPASDVKRGLSGIKLKPATPEDSHPLIRISDGGSRLWLLSVRSCNTWLEFTANFRELSVDFENQYDVLFAGVPQDAGCWHSLIERAKKTTVELKLSTKLLTDNGERFSSPSYLIASDESSDSSEVLGSGSSMETSTKSADLAPTSPEVSCSRRSSTKRNFGVSSNLSGPELDLSEGRLNKPLPKRTNFNLASSDNAHLFSWFAAVPNHSTTPKCQSQERSNPDHTIEVTEHIEAEQNFLVDRNKIEDTLTDMHSFLCTSQFKKNREYRKCPLSTVEEVDATLAHLIRGERNHEPEPVRKSHQPRRANRSSRNDSDSGGGGSRASDDNVRSSSTTASDPSESARRLIDRHRPQMMKTFMKISKTLFQLFLPLDYKSEMISKYWGAINLLIQDDSQVLKCLQSLDSRRGFPKYTPSRAKDVWHCKNIIKDLSSTRAPLPYKIEFPEGLKVAWPHLVMFFVLSIVKQDRGAFGELAKFREIAYGSRTEILKNLARESVHRREAVLPLGITSLIVKNLLEDVTLGLPNIESTYSESLEKLRQDLSSNPYSRVHQEKILRFRQEVACASDVLHDQFDCVNKLLGCVGKGAIHIPRSFQQEREHYILLDSMSSIQARIQSFREMNEDATQLASWNIGRIESNKDRHEAAILVFTTVTVIFLPLSFMASFFGMNTADIRNMGHHQWIFWVCAIPVTLIVIGISLFVIRYFEPARQALGQFLYRKRADELEVYEPQRQRPMTQSYEEPPPPYPRIPQPSSHMPRPNVIIHNEAIMPSQMYSQPMVPHYYQSARQDNQMSSPRRRSHHTAPRESSRSNARFL